VLVGGRGCSAGGRGGGGSVKGGGQQAVAWVGLSVHEPGRAAIEGGRE